MDYLYQRGKFSDPQLSPRPALILLDLNLPGTDGRDVLEQIKTDPELKKIPVIILTTSNNRDDMDRCYQIGASSYIIKPVSIGSLTQAVQRLKEHWFELSIQPDAEASKQSSNPNES